MTLVSDYARQLRFRDWSRILATLPSLEGQRVLDLGAGIGDLAAELAARGARVVGIDGHPELVEAARARHIAGATFHLGDLRDRLNTDPADGIWCSFTAAYFPDLSATLSRWAERLVPGGWIALTEVDDLFGHEPLAETSRALLEAYADQAFAQGRYDFRMGRKLERHLTTAGFTVGESFAVDDRELSFSGPAPTEVLAAWSARFDRMAPLRDFCGAAFETVRNDFLACLARDDHHTRTEVRCCVARLGECASRRS